jgi:hypothetical protein
MIMLAIYCVVSSPCEKITSAWMRNQWSQLHFLICHVHQNFEGVGWQFNGEDHSFELSFWPINRFHSEKFMDSTELLDRLCQHRQLLSPEIDDHFKALFELSDRVQIHKIDS